MTTTHPLPRSSPLLPAIVTGGLLAGTVDALSAFHSFGWGMTYGIASGVLGSKAFPAAGGGGALIWLLGLGLHYLIATTAAAVYCLTASRLGSLKRNFLLGAVLCGTAVWLTMNLVVLPLSAVPFPVGPFTVKAIQLALAMQILLIGLPIAASLAFFARRQSEGAES